MGGPIWVVHLQCARNASGDEKGLELPQPSLVKIRPGSRFIFLPRDGSTLFAKNELVLLFRWKEHLTKLITLESKKIITMVIYGCWISMSGSNSSGWWTVVDGTKWYMTQNATINYRNDTNLDSIHPQLTQRWNSSIVIGCFRPRDHYQPIRVLRFQSRVKWGSKFLWDWVLVEMADLSKSFYCY